jgi:carotenoid cleavage dioxygenase-like enzyme
VLTLQGERKPRRHRYGPGWIAEEHVYVPESPAAAEGRGWVLGTAYHWPTERTTLSVFYAGAVDAGPVASVTLPYGLPLGLHGQFVPA